MSLRTDIKRMTERLPPLEPESGDDNLLTYGERVIALRRIVGAVGSRSTAAPVVIPPELESLEGADFLIAFLHWFFEVGEFWPDWAKDTICRLAGVVVRDGLMKIRYSDEEES